MSSNKNTKMYQGSVSKILLLKMMNTTLNTNIHLEYKLYQSAICKLVLVDSFGL